MLGTIVNTIAILVCSSLGLIFNKKLEDRFKEIVMHALPFCVMLVGISTALNSLNKEGASQFFYIIAITLGCLIGEALRLDEKFEKFGDNLEEKFAAKESNFSKGFVTASIFYCVGSMSIIGSIESGINNNHNILYTKALLDGISSMIMASTMGVGVLFSAFSVFFYQTSITLLAKVISPFMTEIMLTEISIVGGVIVFIIGFNMLDLIKIRMANFLPAILIPVLVNLPIVQNIISNYL